MDEPSHLTRRKVHIPANGLDKVGDQGWQKDRNACQELPQAITSTSLMCMAPNFQWLASETLMFSPGKEPSSHKTTQKWDKGSDNERKFIEWGSKWSTP